MMAYTALEAMRKKNRKDWKKDIGPAQPPLYQSRKTPNNLKSAALRFLRRECEELKFDADKEKLEADTGVYEGKSIEPHQIPYNMEMDINRICLEKALERFIDSGVAEDAYAVYYCYLEIFFGAYGKSKKMVELLSEYESNGSSLLMKHRDHYSHSVYVFALGLAIYETNARYRKVFKEFYGISTDENDRAARLHAAHLFLEFWGLTSLFHDIGYPFELPFEQILSYFEVNNEDRGADKPYLAYRGIETLTTLTPEATARFHELYERDFSTTNELLAYDITQKLGKAYGFDEAYMLDVIDRKPVKPEDFGYFMDHAFFSATRLYRELADIYGPGNLNRMHVDALSAILLHNSLYKFKISFYKDPEKRKAPLRADLHPLAYLLMLCDELQCWDRTAYGRNSRKELHPMAVDFDFSGNAVSAVYYYDRNEHVKIEKFADEYEEWEKNPAGKEEPRLKAYSDMAGSKKRFTTDIEKIVDTSLAPLTVTPEMRRVNRRSKHTYLSGSNFLHFYDFAVTLHGRSMPKNTPPADLEANFTALSLEYQLSTLNRARHFGRYLDAIRCFYTDKPVDYDLVTKFGPRDASEFAPLEHERWIREHQTMGWRYGKEYEELTLGLKDDAKAKKSKDLREQTRHHKLTMDGRVTSEDIRKHYLQLDKKYQDKDWKPFNNLLVLLKKFDGLRIYRLD